MREKLIIAALQNWQTLNANLNEFTEQEAHAALNIEANNQKRKQFLLRLHRKFTSLRRVRERGELLALCRGAK